MVNGTTNIKKTYIVRYVKQLNKQTKSGMNFKKDPTIDTILPNGIAAQGGSIDDVTNHVHMKCVTSRKLKCHSNTLLQSSNEVALIERIHVRKDKCS